MSYEFDKITREDISLIISVLCFSFFMGLIFGDGSFGFTLAVGLIAYCGVMYHKWRQR
jgi:hypothetical protein